MKFVDGFEAFLNAKVNLNQTRIDRLEQSIGAIEAALSKHSTFSKMFLDVIPAGSWAHGTIIRPVRDNDEFDADMLLYLKKQDGWQAKDYLENLWLAFRSNERYKEKAQRKTRCVRIDYQGDFHVDVVPYLEVSGVHCITNRREPEGRGRFEVSDPEAFTAWIDERQRLTNGNFIKVIRLVKYLRDFKGTFDCKSIILMTLLGNQVNAVEAGYHPEFYKDVPSTLVTLLEKLANMLPMTMPAVLDPANTGENFTDRYWNSWNYSNFRNCVISYAQRVRYAYDEERHLVSVKKWCDVFGEEFEPCAFSMEGNSKSFARASMWSSEQFIDHPPYCFPFHLNPRLRMQIVGRVTGFVDYEETPRNGFRQYELAKQGNKVRKNRWLQFTANINVAKPYDIYWKVRNSGVEAAQQGQLRGEICKGEEDSNQNKESTAYKGHHYVECYIVKRGTVVAQDRQDVIVSDEW